MTTESGTADQPGGRIVADRVGLVHGFTQTSACWGEFGRLLTAAGLVVAGIDAPGHGIAAAVEVDDLWGAGEHVGAALTERLGTGVLLGYSMGGRIALHAALQSARRTATGIDALVLISSTAGIDDPDERARRRRADDDLADHLEEIGVDAFVDEWLARPMFASLPPDPECRDARRSNTAAGLAMSLRRCGTGCQEPLWDRLAELEVPTLIVAGADDAKFSELGRRLADTIDGSELAIVDGAGHACHTERPTQTAAVVIEWLGRGEIRERRSRSSAPPH